jgi:hypothetical protein
MRSCRGGRHQPLAGAAGRQRAVVGAWRPPRPALRLRPLLERRAPGPGAPRALPPASDAHDGPRGAHGGGGGGDGDGSAAMRAPPPLPPPPATRAPRLRLALVGAAVAGLQLTAAALDARAASLLADRLGARAPPCVRSASRRCRRAAQRSPATRPPPLTAAPARPPPVAAAAPLRAFSCLTGSASSSCLRTSSSRGACGRGRKQRRRRLPCTQSPAHARGPCAHAPVRSRPLTPRPRPRPPPPAPTCRQAARPV